MNKKISRRDLDAAMRAGIYPKWWRLASGESINNLAMLDSLYVACDRVNGFGKILMTIDGDTAIAPPYDEIGSELVDLALEIKMLTELWWEADRLMNDEEASDS